MEFDNDLTERFNNLKKVKRELTKELGIISMKERHLHQFINNCAAFNGAIIFIIAELMSHKEGRKITPIIYKRFREGGCYPPAYYDSTFVGIALEEDAISFAESKSENIDLFLAQKLGYELYQIAVGEITKYRYKVDWVINNYNYSDYEKDKRMITFGFLLNNYGIRNESTATYSRYDFRDYDYVQDFIIYLFNLQVKNHGKHLTYDDMQKALNDFLELEKNVPKTKTKKN